MREEHLGGRSDKDKEARHRRVELCAETARPVSGQVQKTRRPSLGRQVRVILWSTLNAKLSSDCFQREIQNDSIQEKNLNVW